MPYVMLPETCGSMVMLPAPTRIGGLLPNMFAVKGPLVKVME